MRSFALLTYNVLRLLTWPLWALAWRLRRRSASWVALRLRGSIEELPRARGRLARLARGLRPDHRSVNDVRLLCARIVRDPQVRGLIIRLEHIEGAYPVLASLRHELSAVRAAGKRVVCHLPLGGDQRALYVASVADRVLAMPHAGFSSLGPAVSRTYIAPLLDRLGLRFVVTAEGRFKSAADALVRESMSVPEREQLDAIVRTHHADWVQVVGARPQLGSSGALKLFEHGLYGAELAREAGVVDACVYEDEIAAELSVTKRGEIVAHDRYLSRSRPLPAAWVSLRVRKRVALVRLVGVIRERGAAGGIDLAGTTALFRRLARAKQIAGVVLYVDSPGGSALVSELLHREIRQLDMRKPVVTWMGGVAASGGYYLASATRAIVAHPTTLTGSIGVISLRPVAERLMELLNVRRDVVSTTPFGDLHALTRAPTPAEEQLLRGETSRYYRRFLDVVASGRQRSPESVALLAEGRVWSGADAHVHGLVDVLGGYREARDQVDRLIGEGAAELDAAPLIVSPPRVETHPAIPEPPSAGELSEAAGPLRELAALLASGEQMFAYALGLPRLQ